MSNNYLWIFTIFIQRWVIALCNIPCLSCLLLVLFHQIFWRFDLSFIALYCLFKYMNFLQSNLFCGNEWQGKMMTELNVTIMTYWSLTSCKSKWRLATGALFSFAHATGGLYGIQKHHPEVNFVPTFFRDMASSSSNSTFLHCCKLLLSLISLSWSWKRISKTHNI